MVIAYVVVMLLVVITVVVVVVNNYGEATCGWLRMVHPSHLTSCHPMPRLMPRLTPRPIAFHPISSHPMPCPISSHPI